MRYAVISVFDAAVGSFGRPFFARARGEAMRIFTDEVNSQASESPVFKHPEHFQLFFLGEFDDAVGKFVSVPDMPEKMADALGLKLPPSGGLTDKF